VGTFNEDKAAGTCGFLVRCNANPLELMSFPADEMQGKHN